MDPNHERQMAQHGEMQQLRGPGPVMTLSGDDLLACKLRAHAYSLERSITCEFDEQLAALLRQAAERIDPRVRLKS